MDNKGIITYNPETAQKELALQVAKYFGLLFAVKFTLFYGLRKFAQYAAKSSNTP